MKITKRRLRGFTLIELLVAMVISALLGFVILNVFIQTKRSIGHAIGTVEVVQQARIVTDRTTQFLASAVAKDGIDSILYPSLEQGAPTGAINQPLNERATNIVAADPDTWPRMVVFRTSEDFLNPTYQPEEIMNLINLSNINHRILMDTYKSDAQSSYDYIIWWEDAALDKDNVKENCLMIGRATQLVDASGNVVYRPNSWADVPSGGDPWVDLDPTVATRVIANGVDSVNFLYTMSNGLSVSVADSARVRVANGNFEDKHFRSESLIQLPTLTME